jgi:hypothetical protein
MFRLIRRYRCIRASIRASIYKKQLRAYDQQLCVFARVNNVVLSWNIWTLACCCGYSVSTLPYVLPKSIPGIAKPAAVGLPCTKHPRRRNKESFPVYSNNKKLERFYSTHFKIMGPLFNYSTLSIKLPLIVIVSVTKGLCMLGFYYSLFLKYKHCILKCPSEEFLKLQYTKTCRRMVSDTLSKH